MTRLYSKPIFLMVSALMCGTAFAQQKAPTSSLDSSSMHSVDARQAFVRDSLTVVKADWKTHRVASKSKLYTFHFKDQALFAANQFISYIEVKKSKRAPAFAIGSELKEKKTTSIFGIEHGAVAAINGTFFDVANGGSVDFVKVNGTVTHRNRLDKQGNRARHQQAAIVIEDGLMGLKKWDETATWEEKLTEKDVMLSGPMLVFEGKDQVLDTTSFTRSRHPRSAIGLKPNGTVVLLTVDGRQSNSAGMSLDELRKTMRWLGCTSILNLDGGGSTTLWISGFGQNGVVNFPSDNQKWDHEGQRKVANVILLKPRKK